MDCCAFCLMLSWQHSNLEPSCQDDDNATIQSGMNYDDTVSSQGFRLILETLNCPMTNWINSDNCWKILLLTKGFLIKIGFLDLFPAEQRNTIEKRMRPATLWTSNLSLTLRRKVAPTMMTAMATATTSTTTTKMTAATATTTTRHKLKANVVVWV